MSGEGLYRKSLYLIFNFAMNLKIKFTHLKK